MIRRDELFTMLTLPALSLFPREVWEIILKDDCLHRADLKKIRLVARTLSDIVTPTLFEQICFSANVETIYAFTQLLRCENLVQHVKTLVVYTTTYKHCETTEHYAELVRLHFLSTLELRRPAFSKENLMKILDSRPHTTIPGYPAIENESAQIFRMGYKQYLSAAEFQDKYLEYLCYEDLVCVIACLKGLRRIILSPNWHLPGGHLHRLSAVTWDPEIKKEIEHSESLLDLITRQSEFHPLEHRGWVFTGPGPTARSMHPLHIPPTPTVRLLTVLCIL